MKNNEMKKIVLLGLTAGLLVTTQAEIEAIQTETPIVDLEYLLAKSTCKAEGGCAGLTASRDHNNSTFHDDEELDAQDDNEEDLSDQKNQKELV